MRVEMLRNCDAGVGLTDGVALGDGVADGETVGVADGLALGVAVAVAVAVGDGVEVHGPGPWITTVTGVPVLKKPIVALVTTGA